MACSKYDYERGYEDNRFEIVVSQRFHCPICFLVLKDPVMCKNEHYYCSSCMKKHLENSLFCPTCLEPLTVDTLKPAPRIVNDYICELNIRCDFYPRGCPEMVQVENLKRHVASCGFSPVQCSNEGCDAVMNASDKLQHETEVCDFKKVKCHDCGQLKNEMREMKGEMNDQIKNEMKGMKGEMKTEIKNEMEILKEGMKNEMKGMKEEVKEGMKRMIDQVLMHQDQLQDKMSNEVSKMKNEMKGMKEEMKNEIKENMKNEMKGMKEEMKGDMKGMKEEMKNEIKEKMKIEIKGMKEEMKGKMKEIVMNAVRGAMAEMNISNISSQSSQTTCSSDARENIFLVGGYHKQGEKEVKNKSTECFNWADYTWTSLHSAVFEGRSYPCSFMYQGQMVVAGGVVDDRGNKTNTMKCLNVADLAATWKDFAVNLPVRCSNHKVVNHNDQLFMSGGYVAQGEERAKRSDAVFEVQLVPPYSSKILTRLSQSSSFHGMEMFDQKLFILGGYDDGYRVTASVVEYDFIKNKCKEMPPLPYGVQEMATVLWRNNVLVIGGLDHRYQRLNKVAMYDVITGHSQMLPCMKHKRYGCTAVLTGNVVVVMGGWNNKGGYLKSVECFDLERQVWQDLPDLLEPRAYATAVVKPNH